MGTTKEGCGGLSEQVSRLRRLDRRGVLALVAHARFLPSTQIPFQGLDSQSIIAKAKSLMK